MSHRGARAAVVAGGAVALWLAGSVARADTEIPIRLPFVPAESLPATQVPDDPSSGVRVRIDPGDNEAPDPAPKLVIVLRG